MSSIKTKRGDTLIEVLLAVAIFSIIAVSAVGIMNHGLNRTQASLETTMARTEIDSQAEALRFIHDSYSNDRSFKKLWHYIAGKVEGDSLVTGLSANNPNGQYNQDLTSCAPAYNYTEGNSIYNKKAFVINPRKLEESMNEEDGSGVPAALKLSMNGAYPDTTVFQAAPITPRLIYTNGTYEEGGNLYSNSFDGYDEVARAEGIWVIAVESQQKGKYTEDNNIEVPLYYDFYIQTCWDSPGNNTATNLSTTIRLHNPDAIQSPPVATEITATYYSNLDGDHDKWTGGDGILGSWTGSAGSLPLIGQCMDGSGVMTECIEMASIAEKTVLPGISGNQYYYTDGSEYKYKFSGWVDENGDSVSTLKAQTADYYAKWDALAKVCFKYFYNDPESVFYFNNNVPAGFNNINNTDHCLYVDRGDTTINPSTALNSSEKTNLRINESGYKFYWLYDNANDGSIFDLTTKTNNGGSLENSYHFETTDGRNYTINVYANWVADIQEADAALIYQNDTKWFSGGGLYTRKLLDAYFDTGGVDRYDHYTTWPFGLFEWDCTVRPWAGFDDEADGTSCSGYRNQFVRDNNNRLIAKLLYKDDSEGRAVFQDILDASTELDGNLTGNLAKYGGKNHRIMKIKVDDGKFLRIFPLSHTEAIGSNMYITNRMGFYNTDKTFYYSIYDYRDFNFNGTEEVYLVMHLNGTSNDDKAYYRFSLSGTNDNCQQVFALKKGDVTGRELVKTGSHSNINNGNTCAKLRPALSGRAL